MMKKVNAQTYQWGIGMGGSRADQLNDMTVDTQGNVYVIGNFQKELSLDASLIAQSLQSKGKDDVVVAKYDSLGRLVWAFPIGGSGKDIGNSISLDFAGNFYITGSFEGTVDFDPADETTKILDSQSGADAFLAKYDTSGHFMWGFQIGGQEGIGSGSQVKVHTDGSVFLSGYFGGPADFDPGSKELTLHPTGAFVARYDSKAALLWAFALSDNEGVLGIEDMALDFQGNVHLTGYIGGRIDFSNNTSPRYITAKGVSDIFVAKYDRNANFQWGFGVGDANGVANAQSIAVDKVGNVALTGFYFGKMDFDPGSATRNLSSNQSANIFLVEYTKTGQYLWAKSLGSDQEGDAGTDLVFDDAANLYVSGYFGGKMDADPGTAQNLFSSNRLADIFVIKFNPKGDHQWAFKVGGVDFDRSHAMALDTDRGLYLGGYFRQKISLNPTNTETTLISRGDRDMFFVKYQQAPPSTFYVESFVLYDADKDIPLQTIKDGDVIDINPFNTLNFSVLVNTVPPTVGSLEIILEGGFNRKQLENSGPYTLFGDNGTGNLSGSTFCPDSYSLFAQPYSLVFKGGSLGEGKGVSFRLQGGGLIDTLMLLNADTDLNIRPFVNNDTINLALTGANLSFRAATTCASGVFFEMRDSAGKVLISRSEQTAPFALLGDNPTGNYHPWTPTPGKYSLLVRSFINTGSTPVRGVNKVYNFTVIENLPEPEPVQDSLVSEITPVQKVYPNPSLDNKINLLFKPLPHENIVLQVANSYGEVVFQEKIQPGNDQLEYQLDLNKSGLAQGMYFVTVWLNGKAVQNYRIVKYN
ncbi:MAG: T9SS type A sorting domain-containing protein [Microscillaceae bacterium]|nr:T9SS type A sorting domain-containing protein [Microscillaceae bacterium]